MTLEFHPYANLFPLITGSEFDALIEDVRARGVLEPVDLYEGKILDGRNRYRASLAAGVDVRLVPYEGDDPLGYVISKNLHRRHLDESQRAMVGARLANMRQGERTDMAASEPSANLPKVAPPAPKIAQARAAGLMNVSTRTVGAATKVIAKGSDALKAAVDSGQLPVSQAEKAADLPPEQQDQVAALAAAGKANVVRNIVKKNARDVREQLLAVKTQALPDKRYCVILADPEHRFEVYSRQTGLDRAAENHYPTSSQAEIEARDVASIAADDCLLLLWVTDLERGLAILKSWGFAYKSYFAWVKDIVELHLDDAQRAAIGHNSRVFAEVGPPGTGFWNRDRDELCLIGTRGSVPAPAMGTQGESVIFAARPKAPATERAHHSAKPIYLHEWVDEHFPNVPKIELNARSGRPGWDAWGNEAPTEQEQDRIPVPATEAAAAAAAEPHAPQGAQTGAFRDDRAEAGVRELAPEPTPANVSVGVTAGETAHEQNGVTVVASADHLNGHEADRNVSEGGNPLKGVTGGESAAPTKKTPMEIPAFLIRKMTEASD